MGSSAKTEKCVICRKDTGIPSNWRFDDSRRFEDGKMYVECSGQLCAECAASIYGSS